MSQARLVITAVITEGRSQGGGGPGLRGVPGPLDFEYEFDTIKRHRAAAVRHRRATAGARHRVTPGRPLRREIKQILSIGSNATLDRALRGEPPPEWTRRPRAKDDLHARARELRATGLNYKEIAATLGVSKSSVSLWVRDMPQPERLSYEECRKRSAEGSRLYWETERAAREARREEVRAAAANQIGALSKREIL